MTDPTTTHGILATLTLQKLASGDRAPGRAVPAAARALTTPRRAPASVGWVITPGLVHLWRPPVPARVS